MGSIITTIACCSGNIGENNVDEDIFMATYGDGVGDIDIGKLLDVPY
jgi:hypothetical protein